MEQLVRGQRRRRGRPRRSRRDDGMALDGEADLPEQVAAVGDARRGVDDREVRVAGAGLAGGRLSTSRITSGSGPSSRAGSGPRGGGRRWSASRPEAAGGSGPLAHDLVQRPARCGRRTCDDRQQAPAGRGQAELVRPALEELDAQEPLEPDDVAADRALRDQEGVRRRGEAEVPADRLEGPERVERQPTAVDRHGRQPVRVRARLSSSGA